MAACAEVAVISATMQAAAGAKSEDLTPVRCDLCGPTRDALAKPRTDRVERRERERAIGSFAARLPGISLTY